MTKEGIPFILMIVGIVLLTTGVIWQLSRQ